MQVRQVLAVVLALDIALDVAHDPLDALDPPRHVVQLRVARAATITTGVSTTAAAVLLDLLDAAQDRRMSLLEGSAELLDLGVERLGLLGEGLEAVGEVGGVDAGAVLDGLLWLLLLLQWLLLWLLGGRRLMLLRRWRLFWSGWRGNGELVDFKGIWGFGAAGCDAKVVVTGREVDLGRTLENSLAR